MTEQTFVIIKLDAIGRCLVGKIISRLEDMGLEIECIEMRHKNTIWCREHYRHIHNEDVYEKLCAFMVYRPTIGIILTGPNVISRVRKLIGTTNALKAEPGTIRGDWGKSTGPYNLIHASDSVESVKKEIKLYFDKETDW